jgi:hypothetical protein
MGHCYHGNQNNYQLCIYMIELDLEWFISYHLK